MELTWIAIAASLLMGGSALLIFIWAVRFHQFRNFEDVKYQVFWSDLADPEEVGPEATEAELARLAELAEFGSDPAANKSEARLNPLPQKEQQDGYRNKDV
jgi:cbb3-type cytochrome oxidase maturation protein